MLAIFILFNFRKVKQIAVGVPNWKAGKVGFSLQVYKRNYNVMGFDKRKDMSNEKYKQIFKRRFWIHVKLAMISHSVYTLKTSLPGVTSFLKDQENVFSASASKWFSILRLLRDNNLIDDQPLIFKNRSHLQS